MSKKRCRNDRLVDIVTRGNDGGNLLKVLQISRNMTEITKQNHPWAVLFNKV